MSTTFLSYETTKYYEEMWIAHQLNELSKGKYWFLNKPLFGKRRSDWWSITFSDEWENIFFHFELR